MYLLSNLISLLLFCNLDSSRSCYIMDAIFRDGLVLLFDWKKAAKAVNHVVSLVGWNLNLYLGGLVTLDIAPTWLLDPKLLH